MKIVFAFLSAIFLSTLFQNVNGQNLVPNPSFEDTIGCPINMASIDSCKDWLSFGITPDYYNSCSNIVNVPNSPLGFQFALSGEAYMGLITITAGNFNIREFAGALLLNQLIIGQKYFVSLNTVLSDPKGLHNCACNNLGIRFTTFPGSLIGYADLINNNPQIYSNQIIDDSINWVNIKGSFIADSAYQYIVIGNFFDDMHSDTLHCSDGVGYYFFDDICVSTDSNDCIDVTSINDITTSSELKISPNPASDHLNIESKSILNIIEVYDIMGSLIYLENDISNQSVELNLKDFSKGIYIIRIHLNNRIHSIKVIVDR